MQHTQCHMVEADRPHQGKAAGVDALLQHKGVQVPAHAGQAVLALAGCRGAAVPWMCTRMMPLGIYELTMWKIQV